MAISVCNYADNLIVTKRRWLCIFLLWVDNAELFLPFQCSRPRPVGLSTGHDPFFHRSNDVHHHRSADPTKSKWELTHVQALVYIKRKIETQSSSRVFTIVDLLLERFWLVKKFNPNLLVNISFCYSPYLLNSNLSDSLIGWSPIWSNKATVFLEALIFVHLGK